MRMVEGKCLVYPVTKLGDLSLSVFRFGSRWGVVSPSHEEVGDNMASRALHAMLLMAGIWALEVRLMGWARLHFCYFTREDTWLLHTDGMGTYGMGQ